MTSQPADVRLAWQRRVVDRSLAKAVRRTLDRGAELVLAAASLLEQTGSDSFTVQDVADTAGLNLRHLYLYFDGKDDLLLAVLEEAMVSFARLLRQSIEDIDGPAERLAAAIYLALRFGERSPQKLNLGLGRLRLRLQQVSPQQLAVAQAPLTEFFALLVRAAAEAGEVDAPDADAGAYTILTVIHGYGLSRSLGSEVSLELPTVSWLVTYALRGMDAKLPAGWLGWLEQRWNAMPDHYSVSGDLRPRHEQD